MARRLTLSLSTLSTALLVLGSACAEAETDDPIVLGAGGSDASGATGGTGAGATGGTAAGAGGATTGGTGGSTTGGTGGSTTGGTGGAGGTGTGGTGTGGTGTGGTGGSTGGTGGSTGGTGGGTPIGKATLPLPYVDDFEDGDDADWFADKTNPAESSPVGDWGVVDDGGNFVYQAKTAFDDESWTVGGDRNWTDMRIEARVKFVSELADGDGMIYLAGRWAPGDRDYYFAEFRSTGKPKVRRKTDGSSDDVLTFDNLDEIVAGMGTWHTLALTLSGADVTLEVDGTVLGTVTDTAPLAAGGIALGTRDCVAAFDDVTVSAP